jgi:uncharacterized membrane protein HdeD (DUF308 family)
MDERREQLRSRAQGAAAQLSKKLGDLWRFFMLRGVLAGILGIFALFWPSASLAILITLVGLFILADGAIGLVGALRNPAGVENMLQPVVSIVIGPVLMFWPAATVRLLLIILGVWALVFGLSQIREARLIPEESGERGSTVTVGGITAVIGFIIMLWPGTGTVAISWVIAIAALLAAALLIFVALRMKRLNDRLNAARAKHGGIV